MNISKHKHTYIIKQVNKTKTQTQIEKNYQDN